MSLLDLARKITSGANVRTFAIVSAEATVALEARVAELTSATNEMVLSLDERLDALETGVPQPEPSPPEPSPTPPGTLIWSADMEVADVLQQFGSAPSGYPARINTTLVRDGVTPRHGSRMLRAEVYPGESAPWASTLQASLVQKNGLPVGLGSDVYMGWSTYVVPGFQWASQAAHATLAEWHADSTMLQAPFHWGINALNGEWYCDLHTHPTAWSPVFLTSMGKHETGRWIDCVLRIKWSTGSDGIYQLWMDGVLKKDYTGRTWGSQRSVYPVFGIYRAHQSNVGKVFHDSVRVGTTREIVDPASY
jgi:hypothetical protein